MNRRRRTLLLSIISRYILLLCAIPSLAAQTQQLQDKSKTHDEVVDKIIAREHFQMEAFKQFSPLVEIYIQKSKDDKNVGLHQDGDSYYIGRALLTNGVQIEPVTEESGAGPRPKNGFQRVFSLGVEFLPRGFLQMIYLDTNGFDRKNYNFGYVRSESLGEIQCLVFDVTPYPKAGKGRFTGLIWVDDKDYTIVRFKGVYSGGSHSNMYFHFDSWRMNAGPNLWLPSLIYSEESDMKFSLSKSLSFKAQTRLWGYNLGRAPQEQESSKTEGNIVDRLEKLGLLAPGGEVDKTLEEVVNKIVVGNNLNIQPEIRCRVLLTSTLESFSIGHTIILSRGLIDVLPDEASYATMLSQEIAHIVLGHRSDTQSASSDPLMKFDEKNTFQHFGIARTKEEDDAASVKAVELLKGSIYKDQLKIPSLFLIELASRATQIPNLISPRLGNSVLVKPPLQGTAPTTLSTNQMVARPLGGRITMDPWNDTLEMPATRPIGFVPEQRKLPFEVNPFSPFLVRRSN